MTNDDNDDDDDDDDDNDNNDYDDERRTTTTTNDDDDAEGFSRKSQTVLQSVCVQRVQGNTCHRCDRALPY